MKYWVGFPSVTILGIFKKPSLSLLPPIFNLGQLLIDSEILTSKGISLGLQFIVPKFSKTFIMYIFFYSLYIYS